MIIILDDNTSVIITQGKEYTSLNFLESEKIINIMSSITITINLLNKLNDSILNSSEYR